MVSIKNLIVASMTALALCVPLAACATTSEAANTDAGSAESTEAAEPIVSSKDIIPFLTGQWRGCVKDPGDEIAGTLDQAVQVIDINFADDGTVTIVPLDDHPNLLKGEGTYEGDPNSSVTIHLAARDITLNVVDSATLEGVASDFKISGYDTIYFDYFG